MLAILHTRVQPSVVPTAKWASMSQTSGGSATMFAALPDKIALAIVTPPGSQLGRTKSQALALATPSLAVLASAQNRPFTTCNNSRNHIHGSRATDTATQYLTKSHEMRMRSSLKCTHLLKMQQKAATGANLGWTLAPSTSTARLQGPSMFSNATHRIQTELARMICVTSITCAPIS